MEHTEFRNILIRGDRGAASRMIAEMIESSSVEEVYEDVIKPALYDIGEMWEKNRISIATEHRATAITEGILNEIFPKISSEKRNNRKVVLGSVEGDSHQVGVKMVGDMFEMNGWDAHYLGANNPLSDLLRFVRDEEPVLVALSITISINIPLLEQTIKAIREEFGDMDIMIGGQGLTNGGHDIANKFNRVYFMEDLHDLSDFLKSR
jgi:methanogenic corrinoid protein MtbC1